MSDYEVKHSKGRTSDENQSEARQKERNDKLKGKQTKKKIKNTEKKKELF